MSMPHSEARAGVPSAETLFTLALVLFSLFFIYEATQINDPPRNVSVGPRTFPLIVGLAMLVVSARLAFRQLRAARSGSADASDGVVPLEDEEIAIADWPAVAVVLVCLLGLAVLFEPLGFILAMSLFVFGLATWFQPRRWPRNLIVAVLFSGCFFYIFNDLLEVGLPLGVLAPVLGN